MVTDQDIKKLQEAFATKDDVRGIIQSAVFPIRDQIVLLDNRFVSVEEEIKGLREAVQMLSISIDKLVKSVEDLKQEYSLVVHQLDKHEKWIRQLAEKVGIHLATD